MLLIIMTLVINYIGTVLPVEIKQGEPVPHADILDELLRSHNIINTADANDGSVFDFLFGDENSTSEKLNMDNLDILDISILDSENLHQIVAMARRNHQRDLRRQYPAHWEAVREAYRPNPFLVTKAFDMMKQSIYATRYRLQQTKQFRQQFQEEIGYQIAVVYGSLTQLMYKMDNMHAQMQNLVHRTHFLWYLILYEKMLAAHVDATSMVHQMYNLQEAWSALSQSGGGEQQMQTPPPSYLEG